MIEQEGHVGLRELEPALCKYRVDLQRHGDATSLQRCVRLLKRRAPRPTLGDGLEELSADGA